MVTALILQLVQCIVTLPEDPGPAPPRPDTPTSLDSTADGSKVCTEPPDNVSVPYPDRHTLSCV